MPDRIKANTALVYSSETGKRCPTCGTAPAECRCRQKKRDSGNDGIVRVGRETKGRKGKGVTVITGVPLDQTGLKKLGKELKKLCGTGGTVKDGVIEIQGDHRETLVEALQRYGWQVKRSGG